MEEHNILICVFLLLLFTLPQSQSQPPWDCKEQPYNCGNLSDIFYPFWGQNRPASCGGGSLFNLHCSDDDSTTIRINSQNFTVLLIDQTYYTMKMMRTDLVDDACSPQFNDTHLNPPLFKYPEHMNEVTIFYNCSSSVYSSGGLNFTCKHDQIDIYHVTEGEGFQDLLGKFKPLSSCGQHIQVPSDDAPAFGDGGVEALKAHLRQGFTVSYHVDPFCARCLGMGMEGDCGTDDFEKHLPLCYNCPDGSQGLHCSGSVAHNHKHKLNMRRKIIIGVASAVLGALVVFIASYIWYRRKKNSYAISYIQSRSLSSDPSLKDTEKGSLAIAPGVHLFSYTELEEATNYFDSSRELGEGGFGTVYFGKLPDGRCVAVKRLYENNYRRVEQFMNEIKILTRLVHPNLVTLYGCTSRHGRELLLVYEYIPNGTVADHLHGERTKPGTLPWHIRMNIAVETASALKYLHVSDIIHRDVKTNNILLDSHFGVKVADFGLSRLFPNDVTHISTAPQGTPGYVDPEYHECYQLTSKSDVYSFGVVLIELISSLPAVDITRHRHEINLANMAINKIHNQALHELVDPTLGFESDEKVRKMINAVAELGFQCLQSSKDMRPSMEEVLDTLKDIQSGGKRKSQPEVMDISSSAADDIVLLKDDPPPPSPDSNAVSKSTTPNASG